MTLSEHTYSLRPKGFFIHRKIAIRRVPGGVRTE